MAMAFISGASIIRQQAIYLQDNCVFEDRSVNLDDFLLKAYETLKPEYPKFYKMDRLSKLGFLASEVLLRRYPVKQYPPSSVALVLSNAHASLDTDVKYSEASMTAPSPALFVYTLPNIVAGEICIRNGIKGENAFFVTPAFDPALLADFVGQVLQSSHTQACLAGWIDVMGPHHDVFLYLAEKQKGNSAVDHTAEQIKKLYQLDYGKVDGRS
jgi:hypothetical protein